VREPRRFPRSPRLVNPPTPRFFESSPLSEEDLGRVAPQPRLRDAARGVPGEGGQPARDLARVKRRHAPRGLQPPRKELSLGRSDGYAAVVRGTDADLSARADHGGTVSSRKPPLEACCVRVASAPD